MNIFELNKLNYTKETLYCIEKSIYIRSKKAIITPFQLSLSLLCYSKLIHNLFSIESTTLKKLLKEYNLKEENLDNKKYKFSKEVINILTFLSTTNYIINTITLFYLLLKNDIYSFKMLSVMLKLDPINIILKYMNKSHNIIVPITIKKYIFLENNYNLENWLEREEEIEKIKFIVTNAVNNNILILTGKEGIGKKSLINQVFNVLRNDHVCFTLDIFNLLKQKDIVLINSVIEYLKSIKNPIVYIKDFKFLFTDLSFENLNVYCKDTLFHLASIGQISVIGELSNLDDISLPKQTNIITINELKWSSLKYLMYSYNKQLQFIYNKKIIFSNNMFDKLLKSSTDYMTHLAFPKKGFMILNTIYNLNINQIDENAITHAIALHDPNINNNKNKNVTKKELQIIESNLRKRIYGQEDALNKVFSVLKRSFIGIKDANKPLGSFLLCGPSGTGKTELVKSLADLLTGTSIIRFDMSEYMEKHSISKLIGCPPGYIGHDQGGLLTEAIKNKPRSVVLFDEIEKAHSEINNIMLQLLDEGRITDAKGNVVDCTNTIVVYTSNLGCPTSPESFDSFLTGTNFSEQEYKTLTLMVDKAVKSFFKPEFLNRLDSILVFKPLSIDYLVSILNKFIINIEEKLRNNNIPLNITITEKAKRLMAEIAYHPLYGARPLKRVLNQSVEKPISDLILNYKIKLPHNFLISLIGTEFYYSLKKI